MEKSEHESVSVPDLEWVMTLKVDISVHENLGECCEGWRSNYPITGVPLKAWVFVGVFCLGEVTSILSEGTA